MSLLVPFGDELDDSVVHGLLGSKVSEAKTLSLQDTEPLFHLIHPRAVDRGKMELKSGMLAEPCAHGFAMMDTDIVTNQMN
jgi:hypothetical protein